MSTSRVQVELEEWPADRWLVRTTPLGDLPFLLIESDPDHPEDHPDGLIYPLAILLGGGFTARNLPRLLRGIADLVEEQDTRSVA